MRESVVRNVFQMRYLLGIERELKSMFVMGVGRSVMRRGIRRSSLDGEDNGRKTNQESEILISVMIGCVVTRKIGFIS